VIRLLSAPLRLLAAVVIAVTVVGANPHIVGDPAVPRDPSQFILMPRDELASLPTSGAAWEYLVATAEERAPPPNINDQDSQADTLALAAALVGPLGRLLRHRLNGGGPLTVDPADELLRLVPDPAAPAGAEAFSWMNAATDDGPVTPRIGKPVEINAL
jgi:hypothetical protein